MLLPRGAFPELAHDRVELGEAVEVFGEGDLHHTFCLRLLAVGRQLVDDHGRLPLGVRPEVEVVVEHFWLVES